MFLQHALNCILVIIEGLKAAAACDAGKVNLNVSQMLSTNAQPAKHVMQLSHTNFAFCSACMQKGRRRTW